ncbi:MAG: S-layer homology domain-containing protein, partial [Bacillota bacterium]|nr:S-layer homology domain-containing protein [Bacillota bacterium]
SVTNGDVETITLMKGTQELSYESGAISEEGEYTLSVTARNASNNLVSDKTITFIIDKAAPAISIDGVTDGQVTAEATVVPVFSAADDNLDSVTATLTKDGGSAASFASGSEVTEEGQFVLTVTAIDMAGNETVKVVSFTIDRNAPVISITGVTDGAYYKESVTPGVSVTNGDVETITLMKGTQELSYESGAVSEEGEYTLTVNARNSNSLTSSKAISFTIDTTVPVFAADSPYIDGSKLTFKAGDIIKVIAVSELEGDIIAASFSIAGLGSVEDIAMTATGNDIYEGIYTVPGDINLEDADVKATFTDLAGNKAEGLTEPITIDNAVPEVAVEVSPLEPNGLNSWYKPVDADTIPKVYVTGDADVVKIYYQIDEQVQFVEGNSYNFALPEGQYQVTVWAEDLAGNISQQKQLSVKVDNTAPAIQSVVINDSAFKAGEKIIVTARLEGGADTLSSTTFNLVNSQGNVYRRNIPMQLVTGETDVYQGTLTISEGMNLSGGIVKVRMVDQAGNEAVVAASETITIITVNPQILVQVDKTPGASGWYNQTPSVTLGTSGTDIVYQLNDSDEVIYTSPINIPDGEHTLRFYTEDIAGNRSEGSLNFKVKTVPPASPVVASLIAGSVVNTRAIEIAGTAEASARVVLSVNGTPAGSRVADKNGAYSFGNVPLTREGINNISLYAVDIAGNHSSSTTFTITRDITLPVIEVNVDDAGEVTVTASERVQEINLTHNGTIVELSAADDSDKLFTGNVALEEGENSFAANGTDLAGNVGQGSLIKTVINFDSEEEDVTNIDLYEGTSLMIPKTAFTGQSAVNVTVQSKKIDNLPEGLLVLANPVGATFSSTEGKLQPDQSVTLVFRIPNSSELGINANNFNSQNLIEIWYYGEGDPVKINMDNVVKTFDAATDTLIIEAAVNSFSTYVPLADLTPPVLENVDVDKGISTPVTSGVDITISGDTETGAQVEIRYNSQTVIAAVSEDGSFTATINSDSLAEGDNNIIIAAIDQAGNETKADLIISKDATPPALEIERTPAGNPVSEEFVQFVVTATDANGVADITIKRGEEAISNSSVSPASFTVPLIDGTNSFIIAATDIIGNETVEEIIVNKVSATNNGYVTINSVPTTTTASSVNISGKTDADQVTVSVGNVEALVTLGSDGEERTFSAEVPLVVGSNTITVIGLYNEGESIEKEVVITRSQPYQPPTSPYVPPAAPLVPAKAEETVQKVVAGQLTKAATADGKLEFTLPAGVVSGEGTITINKLIEGEQKASRPGAITIGDLQYEIKVTDNDGEDIKQFTKGLSIELKYNTGDIPAGMTEKDLKVSYWDENAIDPLTGEQGVWIAVPTTVDMLNKKVIGMTNHLSIYGLTLMKGFPNLEDVKGHWAEADVLKTVSLKIASGDPNGSFRPEDMVTREEFAKLIVLAAGLQPEENPVLTFADAADISPWAQGYVAAAVKAGIITGYGDNTFKGKQAVTRAEIAVMLIRALKLGLSVQSQLNFTDVSSIPSWALSSIGKADELGIIGGFPDGTFKANDNATRAQTATMISRMLNIRFTD